MVFYFILFLVGVEQVSQRGSRIPSFSHAPGSCLGAPAQQSVT